MSTGLTAKITQVKNTDRQKYYKIEVKNDYEIVYSDALCFTKELCEVNECGRRRNEKVEKEYKWCGGSLNSREDYQYSRTYNLHIKFIYRDQTYILRCFIHLNFESDDNCAGYNVSIEEYISPEASPNVIITNNNSSIECNIFLV